MSARDVRVARVTPLEHAPEAIAAGRELYLKREDLHEIGAFKWRGALPTLRVYAKDAPVMADSFEAGRVVTSASSSTIADGLAVRVAIPYAVERIQPVVDRVIRVSERELARAVGRLAEAGLRVEASAAASLAGLDHLDDPAEPIVLVITGSNIDDELFERARNAPKSFPD